MALVAEALKAHAGAGRNAFQVDSPTTSVEAMISMDSAMYEPATYEGGLTCSLG
jgi:hypothetical protein